jgi:hypothetical protein
MIALTPPRIPLELTLSHEQFPACAKHLVKQEYVSATELLDVIQHPADHEREFIAFICGVNTDKWMRWDDWAKFLARNVEWRECRETGIEIDPPQLLADLTYVPTDEWPEAGEKVSFSVPACDKQICPDAFGHWPLLATAFREERHGRPIVVWEIETRF